MKKFQNFSLKKSYLKNFSFSGIGNFLFRQQACTVNENERLFRPHMTQIGDYFHFQNFTEYFDDVIEAAFSLSLFSVAMILCVRFLAHTFICAACESRRIHKCNKKSTHKHNHRVDEQMRWEMKSTRR